MNNNIELIINSTLDSQPEGRNLLNTIKVKMSDVESQYHDCDLFKKVIHVKFDINKLESKGYSLQEILELGKGIMYDETERFVLNKLEEFIRNRKK
jgi:hypothetical protein